MGMLNRHSIRARRSTAPSTTFAPPVPFQPLTSNIEPPIPNRNIPLLESLLTLAKSMTSKFLIATRTPIRIGSASRANIVSEGPLGAFCRPIRQNGAAQWPRDTGLPSRRQVELGRFEPRCLRPGRFCEPGGSDAAGYSNRQSCRLESRLNPRESMTSFFLIVSKLGGQFVDFCCEDEIAFGEPVDLVRVRCHFGFPPREQDVRMMSLLFGNRPRFVDKREGLLEIGKPECAGDMVRVHHLPVRNLLGESFQFLSRKRRNSSFARDARFAGKIAHRFHLTPYGQSSDCTGICEPQLALAAGMARRSGVCYPLTRSKSTIPVRTAHARR